MDGRQKTWKGKILRREEIRTMRVEEITETKEVIVKKLYIANDGTVFNNEEECKKHEKTAELMSEYNKLVKGNISEFDLFLQSGNVDYSYDIIEVNNASDIETEDYIRTLKHINTRHLMRLKQARIT